MKHAPSIKYRISIQQILMKALLILAQQNNIRNSQ